MTNKSEFNTNGIQLTWLNAINSARNFQNLFEVVTISSQNIGDEDAGFYMKTLKTKMESLGIDIDPNIEKAKRDDATVIFATLHETARSSPKLSEMAAIEAGKRVSGTGLWADVLNNRLG